MKEEVFDVLLYLFESYAEDSSFQEYFDRDFIESELYDAGFQSLDVQSAFHWLDNLFLPKRGSKKKRPLVQSRSVRVFSSDEMDHLDTECRGFLLFLEQIGVIDEESREHLIERLMTLDADVVCLEQIKWVTLLVIFGRRNDAQPPVHNEFGLFAGPSSRIH
jgi:Smg protein